MKKLVFLAMTALAMSFAACGNGTANGGENDSVKADSIDTVMVDIVDTVAVDTVVAE